MSGGAPRGPADRGICQDVGPGPGKHGPTRVPAGHPRCGHARPRHAAGHHTHCVCHQQPHLRSAAETRTQGVACVTADDFRWKKAHIKSISLLGSVLARQMSADVGAAETIMFRDGFLSEAAAANVWVVKNGVVTGVPKDNLVLEGIRYGLIEELCRDAGIPFELRRIPRDEVFAADELLLSNATKEILPVTRLDNSPLEPASPAPSTKSCTPATSVPSRTHDDARPVPPLTPREIADRLPLAVSDQGDGRQGGRVRRTPSPRSHASSTRTSMRPMCSCATARPATTWASPSPSTRPAASNSTSCTARCRPTRWSRSCFSGADATVRGRVEYLPTYEAMQAFTAARTAATADELWLCEHPPVFTQGLAGRPGHVLDPGAIPVVATNRGGQVTYHGPGPGRGLSAAGPAPRRLLRQGIRLPARGGGDPHPGAFRRDRPPGGRRAGHLRAAGRPVFAAALARPAATPADPFAGPGQDRRPGDQGQPPLHATTAWR